MGRGVVRITRGSGPVRGNSLEQCTKHHRLSATLKLLKAKILYIIVYNNIISVTYYYIQ